MAFERVFTIWDYWDGPRSGIASYVGEPHYYKCGESEEGYSDEFFLAPVSAETFSLAMEQWAIWRDWEAAFHRGEVPESTHPALPGSNQRYAKIQALLDSQLSQLPHHRRKARARFRAEQGQANTPKGVLRELEVEWLEQTSG